MKKLSKKPLTASENKEVINNPITFYVCENGLETSIEHTLSVNEFLDKDLQDFEPNRHWYSITVANRIEQQTWIDLRNRYLSCCWTPNQNREELSENEKEIKELSKQMDQLKIR